MAVLLPLGSVILALGNLAVLWVLGRNRRIWVWSACLWQVPSSAYDVITRQYGWLLMVPFGIALTVKAYRDLTTDGVS